MNVAETRSLLETIHVPDERLESRVGIAGEPPHDFAFITMWCPGNPQRAIVSSPGDRWFEVEVSGLGGSSTGYLYGHTADLSGDDDVREYLVDLVNVAASSWTRAHLKPRRIFKPSLVVELADGRRFELRERRS